MGIRYPLRRHCYPRHREHLLRRSDPPLAAEGYMSYILLMRKFLLSVYLLEVLVVKHYCFGPVNFFEWEITVVNLSVEV